MKPVCYLQTIVLVLIVVNVTAQQSINYKAIINDTNGEVLANTLIAIQFTILENGTTNVFQEIHAPNTDDHGIIVLNISEGTYISGDFNAIDWARNPHFLKTEINTGSGLTDMGTAEFRYVPYAHYAETASLAINDEVNDADADPSNELQQLSLKDDTIYLSQGGFVILPLMPPSGAVVNDLMSYDEAHWVARHALAENMGNGNTQDNMQPWLSIYHVISLTGTYPSRNGISPMIAEIIKVGFNFAPRGWAMCDGQLLSVAQYSALFSLLGTTFGGDGRTTFGLPDLRGRTAIHPGIGPGLSNRRYGERGGYEANRMTFDQMPTHSHTITYQ